ncbi:MULTISPECIES: DsbA family protein [unclassified Mycobacterium]|uniref:DsbA family protein n=1 Tax=unclassified Mycobacterium TaxID=2642494 RepID=UPI000FAF9CBF|nr:MULTISPECIES: DsbA family protein [unclassified Mycobacterium]MDP7702964.1 DsbA family protein [Mycobacterium sp. TY815]MDP7721450.1 DsbA family protein [Mycobacterium sp. TY814]RUP03418.1 MAG: DsbA family protein [Mycobacterium sp.]
MADKPKRPARLDLKSGDGKFGRLIQIGGTAIVVIFAVVLVFYIVTSNHKKTTASGEGAVRVTSSKLVADNGKPKAVVAFYEDFLCPACGNFERGFGPTVSKLIDIGAIAADYSMVTILDSPRTQNYSSRAAAAAYCVADESIEAFRRFHSALYSKDIQPSETGTKFPDNARLIELAREAGAAGQVPDCINSGKYISKVTGLASASNIRATPTIRINGEEYDPSTPEALVTKIRDIVGNIPGMDEASAASKT